CIIFFFSSRRRHTRSKRDWSSDVCSSDLVEWHDLAEAMTAHVRDMADRHRDGLHDFGPRSCETLARTLMARLTDDGHTVAAVERSEERRVGKGGRAGGWRAE